MKRLTEAMVLTGSAAADAKASKNFAWADQIRQELLGMGIVLKDSSAGTTWETFQ